LAIFSLMLCCCFGAASLVVFPLGLALVPLLVLSLAVAGEQVCQPPDIVWPDELGESGHQACEFLAIVKFKQFVEFIVIAFLIAASQPS